MSSMKLGEAMYKASQEKASAETASDSTSDTEGEKADIVDADYEEVKEDSEKKSEG
jgi:molecular chaperone DnaK